MSVKSVAFFNKLRDGVNALEIRLQSLSDTLHSLPKKSLETLQESLEKMQDKLQDGTAGVMELEANLSAQAHKTPTEEGDAVNTLKSRRNIGELERRADRLEVNAIESIERALALIGSAEASILQAAIVRSDATEALEPPVHQPTLS